MSGRQNDWPNRYVVTWPHPLAANGEITSCINACLLCSGVEYGKLSRVVVGALADVSSRSADFAMAEEMMLFWGRVADELWTGFRGDYEAGPLHAGAICRSRNTGKSYTIGEINDGVAGVRVTDQHVERWMLHHFDAAFELVEG